MKTPLLKYSQICVGNTFFSNGLNTDLTLNISQIRVGNTFSNGLNTALTFKACHTVTLRTVKSKMDAAKPHTKQPVPSKQQENKFFG